MSMFQEMEGDVAIVVQNGIYYQTPLYRRGDFLYAKHGGGFVRLMADGATSKAKMRLDHLDVTTACIGRDALGRLGVAGDQFTPLDNKSTLLLTGAK